MPISAQRDVAASFFAVIVLTGARMDVVLVTHKQNKVRYDRLRLITQKNEEHKRKAKKKWHRKS